MKRHLVAGLIIILYISFVLSISGAKAKAGVTELIAKVKSGVIVFFKGTFKAPLYQAVVVREPLWQVPE